MALTESTPDLSVATLLAGDPHRPVLTSYGADGQRVELSAASLVNWSNKVAGLLVDELGADVGDEVAVTVQPGWPVVAVVLGAWTAGLAVTEIAHPDAVAAFVPAGFTEVILSDEIFEMPADLLGLGGPATPDRRNFGAAVRVQADRFTRRQAVPPGSPAVVLSDRTLTVTDTVVLAARAGIPAAARILTAGPWTLADPLAPFLAAALPAGGSLVIVAESADLDRLADLAAAEKATTTYGVSVPGLPRYPATS